MRKRIQSHNRFIALHLNAGDARQQARGVQQLGCDDAGVHAVPAAADLDRHCQFFQRGIAGAFANAVDGAFHLACAAFDGGQ